MGVGGRRGAGGVGFVGGAVVILLAIIGGGVTGFKRVRWQAKIPLSDSKNSLKIPTVLRDSSKGF